MSSVYDNPYKYAVICDVPIELARAVCKIQRKTDKMRYKARKCPVCKGRGLEAEFGSYEEGYGDYIGCDHCGATFDLKEIENGFLLFGLQDFDVILWFSVHKKDRQEKLGIKNIEEWHEWAWKELKGKTGGGY